MAKYHVAGDRLSITALARPSKQWPCVATTTFTAALLAQDLARWDNVGVSSGRLLLRDRTRRGTR